MLKELRVTDFAIIEDILIKFDNGMTVLTGETGAGKSLIIDTISLLLGSRADTDMIRYGKTSSNVIGIFSHNEKLNPLFEKNGIKINDEIEIVREIYNNSKNVIKINGENVTLTFLKEVSSYLADIHVQHDTYKLFNPDNYLDILDPKNDLKFNKIKNDYSIALYKYLNNYKQYKDILGRKNEAQQNLEFLQYEYDELTSANLYPNKDKEIEEKIAKLSNYDKIYSNLNEAYNNLENELDPLSKIYDAASNLSNIKEYDSKYDESSSKLMDLYYIASEIKDDISKDINNLDFSEEELNLLIEEDNELNKLKEKYKKNLDELISYLEKIKLDIEITNNFDEVLEEANKKLKESFELLKDKALKLSSYRKQISNDFAKKIVDECKDLDLENTKFEVSFKDINLDDYLNKEILKESGIDHISFNLTFNKGEPLMPLYKVASGGEASRFMLALKSYLKSKALVDLFIFDEIDTGVSGSTAKKIAIKMHQISKDCQVLCITHLPQVAAIGDFHKHIYKKLENGRTITLIDDLKEERRIEEIAMMLSGDKMSLYALEHAKDLLNNKN